jgi:hypothetical protein
MACLRAMDDDGDIVVVRIKNRLDPLYDSSQSAGYRDVAINFRIIYAETKSLGLDIHVAEVQLMLKSFAEVKVMNPNLHLILQLICRSKRPCWHEFTLLFRTTYYYVQQFVGLLVSKYSIHNHSLS